MLPCSGQLSEHPFFIFIFNILVMVNYEVSVLLTLERESIFCFFLQLSLRNVIHCDVNVLVSHLKYLLKLYELASSSRLT